jgi:hypothetical protein
MCMDLCLSTTHLCGSNDIGHGGRVIDRTRIEGGAATRRGTITTCSESSREQRKSQYRFREQQHPALSVVDGFIMLLLLCSLLIILLYCLPKAGIYKSEI